MVSIAIISQAIVSEDLQHRLTEIYREHCDNTLLIAGDGRLPCKKSIALTESAKDAGVKRLGVETPAMRLAQNK
jgi:biopolymer transport protein ExbD